MVMTTSACATEARAESAMATPVAPALSRKAATRSKPATSWPALTRLAAIGPPILPRPMKAIAVNGSSSNVRSALDHAARHDHAHNLVGAFENLMHAQIAYDLL